MTPQESTILLIFSIVAYMMIVDKNVGDYFTLIFKIIQVNIKRLMWIIVYHPNNFVTTFIKNQKYDRIAKELQKEFQTKNE